MRLPTLLFCTALALPLMAQSAPNEGRAFFDGLMAHKHMEAAGIAPWHMKLSLHSVNAKGQTTDVGTVEMTFLDPDTKRVVFDGPGFHGTLTYTKTETYEEGSSGLVPFYLQFALDEVTNPARLVRDPDRLQWQKVETKGKLKGTCAIGQLDAVSQIWHFCELQGMGGLRITTAYNDVIQVLYDRLGHFGTNEVPVDFTIDAVGRDLVQVHMDELRPLDPATAAQLVKVGSEAKEAPFSLPQIRASSKPIKSVPPVYPVDARNMGKGGTAVLYARIDTAGHVSDAQVVATTYPSFGASALDAVKRWEYSPPVYEGHPEEEAVLIQMSFRFTAGPLRIIDDRR